MAPTTALAGSAAWEAQAGRAELDEASRRAPAARASAPHLLARKLFRDGSPDGSHARLVAMLDNLGKGASGAAVQNLNLMAGLPETAGLAL